MSVCFLFRFYFFFPVYAIVKQTPVLSSTLHNESVRKFSVKRLFQEHNDVVLNAGIKPATLRSLARRSNQLSYAAAAAAALVICLITTQHKK